MFLKYYNKILTSIEYDSLYFLLKIRVNSYINKNKKSSNVHAPFINWSKPTATLEKSRYTIMSGSNSHRTQYGCFFKVVS